MGRKESSGGLDAYDAVSNTYLVTTTMSSKGQIVIPQAVRERCGLLAGDSFLVEDHPEAQAVTLRKMKTRADWFDVYMQCPYPFEVPPRRREFYRRKHALVG